MENVSLIKDIIVAIAAVTMAGLAVFGVNTWRRELHGKSEYDAAHAFLSATYRLLYASSSARNLLITADEWPDGFSPIKEPSG